MKPKFYIITTVPESLCFFDGQYELLSKSFDIRLVSSIRDELVQYGKEHDVKVHYIPMRREISLWADLKGLFLFVIYFLKERPQIVHGNTPKGSLLSMLAAWLTRRPVRIYMCHGLRYQGCKGFKRWLLMTMERITCLCATDVMCVSKGVAEVLQSDNITHKQPVVIWNGSVQGIDIKKFDPSKPFDCDSKLKQYGLKKEDFILTFVGRIVRDKGIQELVEAFDELSKMHNDIRLLLIGGVEQGDNEIDETTKQLIEKNKGIVAPGPQYDIPEILAITNLFVFPSYREGFGLSLMEAGAMGVPSIASNIIGCNEVVEDGKTGILIPSHSVQAIVEAVNKMYSDKILYETMRKNCRDSIVNRYEQQKLFSKFNEFYCMKSKLIKD